MMDKNNNRICDKKKCHIARELIIFLNNKNKNDNARPRFTLRPSEP